MNWIIRLHLESKHNEESMVDQEIKSQPGLMFLGGIVMGIITTLLNLVVDGRVNVYLAMFLSVPLFVVVYLIDKKIFHGRDTKKISRLFNEEIFTGILGWGLVNLVYYFDRIFL